MKKRINDLRPILPGEPLVFLKGGVRHTVSGVCNVGVSVYAQGDDMAEQVLIAYYNPGEFKFEVGHDKPFGVSFVFHGEGECVVYRNPDSLLLTPSPDDTWATYEHRPATDPALANIQRQVMMMARKLEQAEAVNRAYARRQTQPPVKAETVTEPETVIEPETPPNDAV